MNISIPKLSLVVLIGPSGSGKSTFARKHFLPTEVLSSDACRAMVSDDENNQAVTNDAFEVLHFIAAKRLALGRLTVIDATNVQPEARAPLVALARKYHCLPVADRAESARARSARSGTGPGRTATFGPHVIRQQRSQLRRSLRGLQREGFRHVFVLESAEEVEAAVVERVPLWNDRPHEHGPFDIIGDVHGCCDELEQLLERLGYGKIVVAGHEPGWGDRGLRPPRGPQGGLRRRSGGSWAAGSRHAAARPQHGGGRLGPVRARQPRHEAAARSSRARTCRSRTAWPSRWPRSTPCRTTCGTPFTQGAGRVPRRPGQPLRPRRWQAGRRPRRDEGGDAGAGVGQGAGLRPVRRDDRRDRRVRPAGAATTGRRNTGARRWSSTATRRSPNRSGSTARSTSTPAASSAAS